MRYGELEKIIKEEVTSKNYYNHKISIQTKRVFKKEEFITPLLKYLNLNAFYEKQQKIRQKNLTEKIALNDSLINQIDKIIFHFNASRLIALVKFLMDNAHRLNPTLAFLHHFFCCGVV